jgi:hypothetical protein
VYLLLFLTLIFTFLYLSSYKRKMNFILIALLFFSNLILPWSCLQFYLARDHISIKILQFESNFVQVRHFRNLSLGRYFLSTLSLAFIVISLQLIFGSGFGPLGVYITLCACEHILLDIPRLDKRQYLFFMLISLNIRICSILLLSGFVDHSHSLDRARI